MPCAKDSVASILVFWLPNLDACIPLIEWDLKAFYLPCPRRSLKSAVIRKEPSTAPVPSV